MSSLHAVTIEESEFGFQIILRSAFIEVGYNFLVALRESGGKMNSVLKSQRDKFSSVLRADIEKQGFHIKSDHDFEITAGKVLNKIADDYDLPREAFNQ